MGDKSLVLSTIGHAGRAHRGRKKQAACWTCQSTVQVLARTLLAVGKRILSCGTVDTASWRIHLRVV
jgi:hypothetical protein